ncbi:hypothetical protein DRO69_07190 [Candidatus Bathyarchaeota archaeon]|nr:MAG: hypothetical protein DRO69_07190 [Candidatus Bathyarchaeota archaeon]
MTKFGAYIKPTTKNLKTVLSKKFSEVYFTPNPKMARHAKELGLTYVPVIWVPEAKDPKLGVVDIWGNQRLFAFNNSGCPANPIVQEKAIKQLENTISSTESDAAILDALRFPSPYNMKTFFSCFCTHCQKHMKNMGINPDELRNLLIKTTKNLNKYPYISPEDLKALTSFIYARQIIIEDFTKKIHETAKNLNISLWAAVFPPSLAWLVGQNYTILSKYVDEFHIMLYHKCNGAACLNKEIACLTKTLQEVTQRSLENVQYAVYRLTGILTSRSLEELETIGIKPNIIVNEAKNAIHLLGEKAIPTFWYDPQLHEKYISQLSEIKLDKIVFFFVSD